MAYKRRMHKNPLRAYTVAEIAETFAYHANTIRGWINSGELQCYRQGRGNKAYVLESDLLRFFATHYQIQNLI
jgi:excisionase family DNA binding protein